MRGRTALQKHLRAKLRKRFSPVLSGSCRTLGVRARPRAAFARLRQRRNLITSLGLRPRIGIAPRKKALKARISVSNPRRIARQNQAHVCAAAGGIPPGMCECDGVLVAR